MYKLMYKIEDYNSFLKANIELKRAVSNCVRIARDKYGVDLTEIRGFDTDTIKSFLGSSRYNEYPRVKLKEARDILSETLTNSVKEHYKLCPIPLFTLMLSTQFPDFTERSPLRTKFASVGEKLSDSTEFEYLHGGKTEYYDGDAAAFYDIASAYLIYKSMLHDSRIYLKSVHARCEAIAREEHRANRSFDTIRLKSVGIAESLLPSNNSWDSVFNPLYKQGKPGWGDRHNSCVTLMSNSYKPLPLHAYANSSAAGGGNARLPFTLSGSEAKRLKEVFRDDLVINVADNKRGLINRIIEQVEDNEASNEGISIYKTNVIYYRNFNSLCKFFSEGGLRHSSFFNGDDDDSTRLRMVNKGDDEVRRLNRGYREFLNIRPVSDSQLINNKEVIVQEGETVIPGIKGTVSTDRLTYSKCLNDGGKFHELNPYEVDSVDLSMERVDCKEWDIDTTKPAVVHTSREVFFKDRSLVSTGTKTLGAEVSSMPVEEIRYVAVWESDTGHREVVSGTSIKRALANIRRRIRNDIVENLNIF